MAKRLNVLVKNCGNCPNANYMPWGTPVWLCFGTITKNGQPAVLGSSDYDTIPSWCPLPDDVPPPAQAEEQADINGFRWIRLDLTPRKVDHLPYPEDKEQPQ